MTLSRIKEYLGDKIAVTLNPKFWIMLNHYSPDLDKFINDALNEGHIFQDVGKYHASLKGVSFWVENYPYGAFSIGYRFRPSRATIRRAMRSLVKSYLEEQRKNP